MRKITHEKVSDELTHFIPHVLIGQSGCSGLAEQDYPPLSSLSQLQALVVDLMSQFTSGCEYNGTDTRTETFLPL